MEVLKILDSIRNTTSTKEKEQILFDNKDNNTLQLLLKLTYDKVTYNWGVSYKSLISIIDLKDNDIDSELDVALKVLRTFNKSQNSHETLAKYKDHLENLNKRHAELLLQVIDRDLRLNIGKTTINKVWKDLIVKPPYQRCSIGNEKTFKNISYPACLQLKQDGTYRSIDVIGSIITSMTRSGEDWEVPDYLKQELSRLPNGTYLGELLVKSEKDRAKANGLINSKTPPNDIEFVVWDYLNPITKELDYYGRRKWSIINKIEGQNFKHIRWTESVKVNSLEEALAQNEIWIKQGYEGSILKDLSELYRDGTSKLMLKLKPEHSAEVRITGFIEGKLNTKRAETFGSIAYSTDDGLVAGFVSGLTDKLIETINNNREEYIGKIIEIKFTELTKDNALLHPRFVEIRDDKTETDTLDSIKEMVKS